MADRVSASIVLGGTINTTAFAELIALIEPEGLSIEWDGEPFQPGDITPRPVTPSLRPRGGVGPAGAS